MTSKLIDKMLPSATNHKVDVTVKKMGRQPHLGGRGEAKERQFPNILAKPKVKAREALNRLSS